MFNREACLELTHNWGSEDDPDYKAHNGNEEPKGYCNYLRIAESPAHLKFSPLLCQYTWFILPVSIMFPSLLSPADVNADPLHWSGSAGMGTSGSMFQMSMLPASVLRSWG